MSVCVKLTCPCCVWKVHLCDESVSVRTRLSKVSRFRMDHMTLSIRIKNLQMEHDIKTCMNHLNSSTAQGTMFISTWSYLSICPAMTLAQRTKTNQLSGHVSWRCLKPTWTLTLFWGSWMCSSVASISSATTRPDVKRSGLSDSPVGSMMVAVARWICWEVRKWEFKQENRLFIGVKTAVFTFLSTWLGSWSCSRPLCLSVVCRIFTSSAGLQFDSRGISSSSLSTKLSWRWGNSVRNSLVHRKRKGAESSAE